MKSLLVEGAIRGMAEALEDPHSTYLTKEEAENQEASLSRGTGWNWSGDYAFGREVYRSGSFKRLTCL